MELRDAVVVVTGAGSGIGRATALEFATRGARLALVGRRQGAIDRVADEIAAAGGTAFTIACDVRDAEQVERMVNSVIERFTRLDILVNNAGIALRKSFHDTTESEWRNVMETNVTGPFLCSRSAARFMLTRGGGVVINVSSTLGRKGAAGFVAYSASKAALLSITEVLAEELRASGITVLAVCPGSTQTDLHIANVGLEAARDAMPPERVARRIVEIAAGEQAMASGSAHVIDDAPRPPGLVNRALRRIRRLLRGSH